jgi:hypothetical protein
VGRGKSCLNAHWATGGESEQGRVALQCIPEMGSDRSGMPAPVRSPAALLGGIHDGLSPATAKLKHTKVGHWGGSTWTGRRRPAQTQTVCGLLQGLEVGALATLRKAFG